MCNTKLCNVTCSHTDHKNHLLDESFSSGFAFAGVLLLSSVLLLLSNLLLSVSSVVMKDNNQRLS